MKNTGAYWYLTALTVFFSLIGIVMWGTLSGAMIPVLLKSLKLDPATSSAPFVATLVDVTGLIIYFTFAAIILRGTILKGDDNAPISTNIIGDKTVMQLDVHLQAKGLQPVAVNDSTLRIPVSKKATAWWQSIKGATTYRSDDYHLAYYPQNGYYDLIVHQPEKAILLVSESDSTWKEFKLGRTP
jgi:hypothetical protein